MMQRLLRAGSTIRPLSTTSAFHRQVPWEDFAGKSQKLHLLKSSDPGIWQRQKQALSEKFGRQGWRPRKRLSPDTLQGIRQLHDSDPVIYSTSILAEHFKISPEAIRRILKSKWRPNEQEVDERRARWEKRGLRKWTDLAKAGAKMPEKWRLLSTDSVSQSSHDLVRNPDQTRPEKDLEGSRIGAKLSHLNRPRSHGISDRLL